MSDQPWRCGYCQRQTPHVTRRGTSAVCTRCRETLAAKGKRWCSGCKQVLPVGRFPPIGGRPGQRRGQCYRCRQPLNSACVKRWRHRYPERYAEIQRRYKAANPERVRRWSHDTYRRRIVRLWRREVQS